MNSLRLRPGICSALMLGAALAMEPLRPRSGRQVPPTPDTVPRDDAFYIARAKERRFKRAIKQAVNARRTCLGKYNATLSEVHRAQRLMEAMYAA